MLSNEQFQTAMSRSSWSAFMRFMPSSYGQRQNDWPNTKAGGQQKKLKLQNTIFFMNIYKKVNEILANKPRNIQKEFHFTDGNYKLFIVVRKIKIKEAHT